MERSLQSYLSPQATALLSAMETTSDETVRLDAIHKLSQTQDPENARALMQVFEKTPWRSIRMAIMRGLGQMGQSRATDFLIRWASHPEDLPMAATAILSLGETQDAAAGEFLLTILLDPTHPLRREAVMALSRLEAFPLFDTLDTLFRQLPKEGFASLRQYLIIAAGITGCYKLRDVVHEILEKKRDSNESMLFSAALLTAGRIGNTATSRLLNTVDTHQRFFAEQLRQAAFNALSLRLQAGVEDAVNALIAADSAPSLRQALNLMQAYPLAEAWEAVCLFESELTLDKKAWARVILSDPTRFDEDRSFFKTHWEKIDRSARAALFRWLSKAAETKGGVWFQDWPVDTLATLAMDVKNHALGQLLIQSLNGASGSSPWLNKVINALVRQAFMYQIHESFRLDVGRALQKVAQGPFSVPTQSRALRALGQIHWQDTSAMQTLAQNNLKTDAPLLDACYAMLANHGDSRWGLLISKRLRIIGQRPEAKNEVAMALNVLGELDRTDDGQLNFEIHPDHKGTHRLALLQILAKHVVAGCEDILAWGLASQDFQTLLLALAACRSNGNDNLWPHVMTLTSHPNACLRGRAIDSLCVAAGPREHGFLIGLLPDNIHDEEFVKKVLRSLIPSQREGVSYKSVVESLRKLVTAEAGCFKVSDVKSSALHLIDRLTTFDVLNEEKDLGTPKEKQTVDHGLDEELHLSFDAYHNFSETVRSIIRNAELTYRNPKLFDERVDKSTIVVEYVKSIDIYLQEKLGTPLFSQSNRDLLAKMQSLILKLDLDREQLDAKSVTADIECADVFKPFDFPTHKLQSLCRSIMSGKIMQEQYRVIDGLRSWALLLLIFGRSFKFQGQKLEAIFPIRNKNAKNMAQLCFELNAMQELRNHAAHRATLSSGVQIEEFRKHSLNILNQLAAAI